jgi:PleD family two-component response regulator
LTASFGVAWLVAGSTAETWIAAADAALYEAKHNGRNQRRLAEGRLA